MLDIRFTAENSELVKESLSRRGKGAEALVDTLKDLYNTKRELLKEVESLKALRNKVSGEIAVLKKQKAACEDKIAYMKEVGDKIAELDGRLNQIEPEIVAAALNIPNTPHESVPDGADEKDNVEVRSWGTKRAFDFEPKPHWELGESLNILDPQTAAKITGARFTLYRGDGAKLERALMNFMLDTHFESGYTEVFPPFMVNSDSMYGTGQLPKFKEDAFALKDTNYYLVPTAEVPVTNMHRGETLTELPLKYCAYTSCFRAEAGSAGRDTRGLIRQHQFQKVELVRFCRPEDSLNQLEELTANAEKLLQLLGLAYRVVALSAGDLGFGSAKTYDIEVWLPSYNRYVEISSCSNYMDFQARRMGIKYPAEKGLNFVHTLNGSGLPLGRTAAAIIENYQNADGTITVPEVLRKYMNKDKIG